MAAARSVYVSDTVGSTPLLKAAFQQAMAPWVLRVQACPSVTTARFADAIPDGTVNELQPGGWTKPIWPLCDTATM